MRSFVPTDEENTPFREAINRSVYCSLASVCNRTHRVRLTTGRVDATLDGASVPSRSRQQRDIMRMRRGVPRLVVVCAIVSVANARAQTETALAVVAAKPAGEIGSRRRRARKPTSRGSSRRFASTASGARRGATATATTPPSCDPRRGSTRCGARSACATSPTASEVGGGCCGGAGADAARQSDDGRPSTAAGRRCPCGDRPGRVRPRSRRRRRRQVTASLTRSREAD